MCLPSPEEVSIHLAQFKRVGVIGKQTQEQNNVMGPVRLAGKNVKVALRVDK